MQNTPLDNLAELFSMNKTLRTMLIVQNTYNVIQGKTKEFLNQLNAHHSMRMVLAADVNHKLTHIMLRTLAIVSV